MTDWQKITEALQAKLDAKHVCPPKQFGPKGDYLEGWHVMAEANRIFGFNGWQYEVTECTCVWQGARDIGRDKKPGFGVSYTAKVRVVAGGVVREDFGAGHGYDVDCGLAHESAIKEAVTDAYKRAMRSFGNPFGLALYDKSRENVETAQSVDAAEGRKTAAPSANAIQHACDSLSAADSMEQLAAIWKGLPREIQADARAIKTKDARKAELTTAAQGQAA
jgi:DNA recombination protein Rad52